MSSTSAPRRRRPHSLEVALRDGRTPVARAGCPVWIAAHDTVRIGSAELLGRFFD